MILLQLCCRHLSADWIEDVDAISFAEQQKWECSKARTLGHFAEYSWHIALFTWAASSSFPGSLEQELEGCPMKVFCHYMFFICLFGFVFYYSTAENQRVEPVLWYMAGLLHTSSESSHQQKLYFIQSQGLRCWMSLCYVTDLLKLLKLEALSSCQIVCRAYNGPLEKIRKLDNNREMSKTYNWPLLNKWCYMAAPLFSSCKIAGNL